MAISLQAIRGGPARGLPDTLGRAPTIRGRAGQDLNLLARTLLPGLGNMVGAVLSDTVGRAGRAIIPGGSRGDEGLASWDAVIKPIGESMLETGRLVGDLAQAPAALLPGQFGGERRDALAGRAREFAENPVLVPLEHIGNAALAGSAASIPLAAGARAAAGVAKPTRAALRAATPDGGRPNRGAVVGARQQQLRDIASSGESGAGMARAALASRNIVGRPYTATVRVGMGARMPARANQALFGAERPSASPREIVREFRESGPVRLTEEGVALYQSTQPTSPVARFARQLADTDLGQGLASHVGSAKRSATRLRESIGERVGSAAEDLSRQTPAGRQAAFSRYITSALRDPEFGPVIAAEPALARLAGRVRGQRWDQISKMAPDDLHAAAQALSRIDPERLPRHLRDVQPHLVVDLYETATGTKPGTLLGATEVDIHLGRTGAGADPSRPYGDALREGIRVARERGVAPESLPGLVDLPPEMMGTRLADLPAHVQAALAEVRHRNTAGADRIAREMTRGEHGILEPHMGPIVRQTETGWRAPTPDEAVATRLPDPQILPGSRQARKIESMEADLKKARLNLEALEAKHPTAGQRATVAKDVRKGARELTRLARAAARETDPGVRRSLADQVKGARHALEQIAHEAGTRLPDQLQTRVERLHMLTELDHQALRAEIVPTARKLEDALWRTQEPLIRLSERGSVSGRAIQRAAQKVSNLEDRIQRHVTAALESVEAAPAVARPRLVIEREAGRLIDGVLRAEGLGALADDLGLLGAGTTVERMNAAGVQPGFITLLGEALEGRTDQIGGRHVAVRAGRDDGMRQVRGAVDHNYDRTRFEQDLSLATRIIKDDIWNEAQTRYMQGSDSLAQSLKLDDTWWRDASPAQRAAVLHERGFVRWDKGAQAPINSTGPTQHNDLWVHRHIAEGLDGYVRQNLVNTLTRGALNPAMRAWKGVTLAMRPAWQIGNAVSNMFMAQIHGRVDPLSYFRLMTGEAIDAMRRYSLGEDPTLGRLRHADVDQMVDTRLSRQYDEAAGVRGGRVREDVDFTKTDSVVSLQLRRAEEASGAFSRFVSASYALNNYVDNLNRITVALANADGPAGVAGGLRLAQEALGNYSKMTGFERQYVKSLFPFWAWQRHITVLTARQFAPDNMTRTAMGLHLAHLAAVQDEWREMVPHYQAGGLEIPFLSTDERPYVWNNRNLNPFQDAVEPFIGPGGQFSPASGIARQAGPVPSFAIERMTGMSSFTGRPFTQAVPQVDQWGREINTAPPLAEHAFTSFGTPLGGLARNLGRRALGRTTARYDSGEPMLWEDQRTKPILEDLAQPLVGSVGPVNLEGLGAARARALPRQIGAQQRRAAQEEQAKQEQRLLGRLLPGL